MKEFVVEFSGWVTIDSDDIEFVNFDKRDCEITGTEYLKLTDEEKDNYVLVDLSEVMAKANDGSYEQIDISTQDV